MDFTNFTIMMCILIAVTASYAMGRLQQWMRQTDERDRAYREGYNVGYDSAVRTMPKVVAQLSQVAGPSTGRHGGGPGQERLTTTDVLQRWRRDRTVVEGNR